MTTPPATTSDEKRMRLRYAGASHLCGEELPAGELAVYERGTRRVRCISCPSAAITPGKASFATDAAPDWSAPFGQIQTAPELSAEPAESPDQSDAEVERAPQARQLVVSTSVAETTASIASAQRIPCSAA